MYENFRPDINKKICQIITFSIITNNLKLKKKFLNLLFQFINI